MKNAPTHPHPQTLPVTPTTPTPETLPALAPDATALAPIDDADFAPPAPIDPHGFDPTAYDWVPRPRKPRKDGWTAEKQRTFIETLADTGLVVAAARQVDMSLASCYRLRREPGGHGFAAAWEAAVQQASHRLIDIAFDRAVNGVEDPVFDAEGRRIACRYRYNDRLLMFLLRAHRPDRYRHAHHSTRQPAEPHAPDVLPVPVALDRLIPAQPAAPHHLMDAERLTEEVEIHDRIAAIDADSPPDPAHEPFREPWQKDPEPEAEPDISPLGEEFERLLAWAKLGLMAPADDSWPPESPAHDDADWDEDTYDWP